MGCNRRRNEEMFGYLGFHGQTSIYRLRIYKNGF